jgi:hypothetical protein
MWSCHIRYKSSISSMVTDLVIIHAGIGIHRLSPGAYQRDEWYISSGYLLPVIM